jgi:hypothetical protein
VCAGVGAFVLADVSSKATTADVAVAETAATATTTDAETTTAAAAALAAVAVENSHVLYGVMVLLASTLLDAVSPNLQESVMAQPRVTPGETMLWTNVLAVPVLVAVAGR